ncbi:unnamed protein product [Calypogeia fissa]
MKGTEAEETVTSSRVGVAGRETRKKVPKFSESDKENFSVYGGDMGLNENKSPLPVGYPRAPLQDITAVLQPVTNNSDEEEPTTVGVRKPVTRSQGRKMGNVHTTAFCERISKNVNRAGPSKTRKKQVIKLAVYESKTVTLTSGAGQSKQETTQQTSNVSISVKPPVQGQTTEEQRRRKPLSERSSVSRFR